MPASAADRIENPRSRKRNACGGERTGQRMLGLEPKCQEDRRQNKPGQGREVPSKT
jgi:hypothetical protein